MTMRVCDTNAAGAGRYSNKYPICME